eukprot:6158171-Amphidinium_carterae.1
MAVRPGGAPGDPWGQTRSMHIESGNGAAVAHACAGGLASAGLWMALPAQQHKVAVANLAWEGCR